jgi:glucose-6-phosphate isomerase
MIKFDFETYLEGEVSKETFIAYSNAVDRAKNEFLKENKLSDWYQFDNLLTEEELTDIEKTAQYIKNNCEVFIVIGVGGSYLGAKGIIDALSPYFKRNTPEIIFAGNSLSSEYLTSLIDYIRDKEVILNVISKSGNTLEPSITFNAIYKSLKARYHDDEIRKRIFVTTDSENGQLLEVAKRIGCKRFVFPTNVGGRFSTLTPVGLLPIAVVGIDIRSILDGAKEAKNNTRAYYSYIAIRDYMYKKGKKVEIFNVYEPKLESFLEWVQQIFAETQGKGNKGILPVPVVNTGKLHSLGQYLQEGDNIAFETSIDIERSKDFFVERYSKYLDAMNTIALKSVAEAHHEAKRYTSIISMDELNAYNMGYLYAFFSISSAFGAYILGVDYSNEPGVRKYKQIMNDKLNI